MLKVLMIHDYPPVEGGGVEVNVYQSSLALEKLGAEVKIGTSRFSSETYATTKDALSTDGIEIIHVKTKELLQELISWADLVHIHLTFSFRPAAMLALRECVKSKKACVVSLRTEYAHLYFSETFEDTPLEKDIKLDEVSELLSSENVHLSAPAASLKATLERLGVEKSLSVVRNGVQKVQKKASEGSKSGIKEVDATYVGELSFLKGVNYLIDAVRQIVKEKPQFKLRLIGEGSHAIHMKRLVDFFGLQDNVEFAGYIKNGEVLKHLEKSRLYVHPSLTESWGNAVVEAMSVELPVICTSVGGLLEVTENGKLAASLVPPADATALADAILTALEDKDYADLKKDAKNIAKTVSEKYTYENQAQQLLELYKEILN